MRVRNPLVCECAHKVWHACASERWARVRREKTAQEAMGKLLTLPMCMRVYTRTHARMAPTHACHACVNMHPHMHALHSSLAPPSPPLSTSCTSAIQQKQSQTPVDTVHKFHSQRPALAHAWVQMPNAAWPLCIMKHGSSGRRLYRLIFRRASQREGAVIVHVMKKNPILKDLAS